MRKIKLNAIIILSLAVLAFIVLDWYNAKMCFLENSVSTKLLIIFCLLAMNSSLEQLLAEDYSGRKGAGENYENRN